VLELGFSLCVRARPKRRRRFPPTLQSIVEGLFEEIYQNKLRMFTQQINSLPTFRFGSYFLFIDNRKHYDNNSGFERKPVHFDLTVGTFDLCIFAVPIYALVI